jgi:hypothetical protein
MIYGTQEFAELLKDLIRDGRRHDLYEQSCHHAKEMAVHINGEKPIYLLDRNRPREDEEIKMYRIENYEPTTKAGADKSIKIVSKGFNPNLYSIVWKEPTKEGEELEKYTLEYYPNCNSIVNFNKDVLLRKMLADPNGLVAIKPEDIPDDDTEKLKPIIIVYGSACLWYYDRDHYLVSEYGEDYEMHRSEEDKQNKRSSVTFEYYDKTQYINFTATYDASDKSVEIVENIPVYRHNGGRIPAWFLGGESKNLDNGKILYQSFFSAALPHWNLAVKHGSDLMASIVGHIFPQKYEVADECAYKRNHAGQYYGCRGGKITYPGGPNGSSISTECPQCFGTGLVSVKGPLQTYQFLKEKLSVEGTGFSGPPVGFIDVPIDSTTFLDEYTDKMNQKALSAINMDIEEKVGENQSGVAKAIDRTAQNDTIFDIHSRIWDVHTNNEYYYMNMYMNSVSASATGKEGDQKFLPEINKPTKFDLLTTSELIFNYKVSKDSGLDRNLLRSQAVAIIKGENGSTPDMQNYQIALVELDPLFGATSDEIDLGVSKGVIRKADWSIHENVKAFIDKAIAADKKFLSKEKQDQIAILEGFATELIDSEKPRINEAAMSLSFDQQNAA